MNEAWRAEEELSGFLKMDVSPEYLDMDTMKNAVAQSQDASAILRLHTNAVKSSFVAVVHKVSTNLSSIIPAEWRTFTIVARQDEVILEKIVNSSTLDSLLARRSALSNSWKIYGPIVSMLMQKVLPANRQASQKDYDKLAKDTEELLSEALMMVAVRASTSVAFVNIPCCKGSKSKAATLREAKRLVASLGLQDFSSRHHENDG